MREPPKIGERRMMFPTAVLKGGDPLPDILTGGLETCEWDGNKWVPLISNGEKPQ